MNGSTKCSIYMSYKRKKVLMLLSVDEPWKHHVKVKKLDKKGHILCDAIYRMSRIDKFIDTESRLLAIWG